jgi:gliding motility-associated-like protein
MTDVTLGPVTVPFGATVQLNANGAYYYEWTPNDGSLSNNNISNPIAHPVDTTTVYTVYGRNLFGCLDSATVIVNVDFGMADLLPSGFTPNNDGLNDVFKLHKFTYQKLVQFSVYNRWGVEVFRTINPEVGWDGTYQGVPQDIGVYNYQVIVAHPDGTNKTYKGNVTLIR